MRRLIAAACDAALYDPATAGRGGAPHRDAYGAGGQGADRRGAKRDNEAADYVHWGATSQDVLDTAMVLQLGEALPPLLKDIDGIVGGVRRARARSIARRRCSAARCCSRRRRWRSARRSPAGRPISIARSGGSAESFAETQVVQFGGASGSLSALGDKAEAVMTVLAKELQLPLPPAPWFTQRVRVAALAQDIALVCGALGKAARDISLMMQIEVGEASEPSGPGRGGSSTMPHKRNPVGAALTWPPPTARRMLAATIVSGMVQEHERALGGWQSEWPTIAALCETLGSAVEAMKEVAPGLADRHRRDPGQHGRDRGRRDGRAGDVPAGGKDRQAEGRTRSSRRRWPKAAPSSKLWASSKRNSATSRACWAIRPSSSTGC